MLDDALDGFFQNGEKWFGVDADPEDYGEQGQEHGVFADAQVGESLVRLVGNRAEHGALIQREQIGGAQHDSQCGPCGPRFVDDERSLQDGEFADEAIEQRHAQQTERDDQVDGREIGHRRGQAAELGNQAGVAAFIERAEEEEERGRGDAVIDLLQDAAGESLRRQAQKFPACRNRVD